MRRNHRPLLLNLLSEKNTLVDQKFHILLYCFTFSLQTFIFLIIKTAKNMQNLEKNCFQGSESVCYDA
jgi:hypothetical protein